MWLALVAILLFFIGLYITLCQDGVLPTDRNFVTRLKDLPLENMPTTNGLIIGMVILIIVFLLGFR